MIIIHVCIHIYIYIYIRTSVLTRRRRAGPPCRPSRPRNAKTTVSVVIFRGPLSRGPLETSKQT